MLQEIKVDEYSLISGGLDDGCGVCEYVDFELDVTTNEFIEKCVKIEYKCECHCTYEDDRSVSWFKKNVECIAECQSLCWAKDGEEIHRCPPLN